jgi:hypothetical protein
LIGSIMAISALTGPAPVRPAKSAPKDGASGVPWSIRIARPASVSVTPRTAKTASR